MTVIEETCVGCSCSEWWGGTSGVAAWCKFSQYRPAYNASLSEQGYSPVVVGSGVKCRNQPPLLEGTVRGHAQVHDPLKGRCPAVTTEWCRRLREGVRLMLACK
jgi:hypothetical protein